MYRLLLLAFVSLVVATPFVELTNILQSTCEHQNWTWEENYREPIDNITPFLLQLFFGWIDVGNVYKGYFSLLIILVAIQSFLYITWDVMNLRFPRNMFISLICLYWIVSLGQFIKY